MTAAAVTLGVAHAATTVAPVNTAPPTITGTPQVGQTLTAGNGTWTNSPTSFAYQWLRCNAGGNSCVSVANGTQKTYTLVGADAGHTMRVRVTATNADGSASAQSDQTTVVAPATSSQCTEEHRRADDLRYREGRGGAHGERRIVDGQSDRVCLPVAAL